MPVLPRPKRTIRTIHWAAGTLLFSPDHKSTYQPWCFARMSWCAELEFWVAEEWGSQGAADYWTSAVQDQ